MVKKALELRNALELSTRCACAEAEKIMARKGLRASGQTRNDSASTETLKPARNTLARILQTAEERAELRRLGENLRAPTTGAPAWYSRNGGFEDSEDPVPLHPVARLCLPQARCEDQPRVQESDAFLEVWADGVWAFPLRAEGDDLSEFPRGLCQAADVHRLVRVWRSASFAGEVRPAASGSFLGSGYALCGRAEVSAASAVGLGTDGSGAWEVGRWRAWDAQGRLLAGIGVDGGQDVQKIA